MDKAPPAARTHDDGRLPFSWDTLLLSLLALVLAALAVTLGLWTPSNGGESESGASNAIEGAHIHGLAIDPRGGALLAGTHLGTFEVDPDGSLRRISAEYQDTMGLTSMPDGRLIASGHPDLRNETLQVEGRPPLLGLVESEDGSRTWQSLSLLGEVDFHALAAVGQTVYGADSTGARLMVSTDLRKWEVRAEIDLIALAADPDDTDRLVGATAMGIVRSADGGRTWAQAPGPPVSLLTWSETGELWGASANGAVYVQEAGRGPWRPASPLRGEVEALLADGRDVYAALAGDAVYHSTDAGVTWTTEVGA